MITIRFHRGEAGRIAGFEVRGHALFAEAGTDIVCAGVSALVQTALLGLEQCAGASPSCEVAKGRLQCALPPASLRGDVGQACWLLLESMVLGLREIQARYPGYVRIEDAARKTKTRREASK